MEVKHAWQALYSSGSVRMSSAEACSAWNTSSKHFWVSRSGWLLQARPVTLMVMLLT